LTRAWGRRGRQTPRKAAPIELTQFHDHDYIRFLERVAPDHAEDLGQQLLQFGMGGMGTDCPAFEGLFDFCQRYAGASIEGAVKLNHGLADIAINWAGGLHHAKKTEASGAHPAPAALCSSLSRAGRRRTRGAVQLFVASRAPVSTWCGVRRVSACRRIAQG